MQQPVSRFYPRVLLVFSNPDYTLSYHFDFFLTVKADYPYGYCSHIVYTICAKNIAKNGVILWVSLKVGGVQYGVPRFNFQNRVTSA